MEPKYTVTLHIRREADGKEATLRFDENRIAEITNKNGADLGRFRLVPEGLPDMNAPRTVDDATHCLAECTTEGNSLPYCLVICGAAA